jgi:1-aminocyclopropane-1-carboxylate deaminase/D-cysteine desulfhydrase-like pyridoxal-dependent ACC family enzyme
MDEFSIDLPSPAEKIFFRDEEFFLKRDDLLHGDFSGNKARKFHYYLTHDLPNIKKVISYGSNQSNAMYSLSVLARMKGWEFEYYVDHIPEYLRENPVGNYARALANGMVVREQGGEKREEVRFVRHSGPDPESHHSSEGILNQVQDNGILWIEEGGRQKEAEYGIRILAEEIVHWQEKNSIGKLDIFLPSGTGTSRSAAI